MEDVEAMATGEGMESALVQARFGLVYPIW